MVGSSLRALRYSASFALGIWFLTIQDTQRKARKGPQISQRVAHAASLRSIKKRNSERKLAACATSKTQRTAKLAKAAQTDLFKNHSTNRSMPDSMLVFGL